MGDINTENTEEAGEKLGQINQIRDIIFGAQMREYNSRLERLESQIAGLQQDTRDRLERLKDHLLTELRQRIDEVERKLKSDRAAARENNDEVRQQIDRLTRRLFSSTRDLDEAIDQQASALRSELSQTSELLQADLAALRGLVLEEIDRRFSTLGETKVSRDDLAETLVELGMRLKGTELLSGLREGSDPDAARLPLRSTELEHRVNGAN